MLIDSTAAFSTRHSRFSLIRPPSLPLCDCRRCVAHFLVLPDRRFDQGGSQGQGQCRCRCRDGTIDRRGLDFMRVGLSLVASSRLLVESPAAHSAVAARQDYLCDLLALSRAWRLRYPQCNTTSVVRQRVRSCGPSSAVPQVSWLCPFSRDAPGLVGLDSIAKQSSWSLLSTLQLDTAAATSYVSMVFVRRSWSQEPVHLTMYKSAKDGVEMAMARPNAQRPSRPQHALPSC